MLNINPIWLLIGSILLAFIPIVLGLVTSYIKVSVVLGLLRSGIGSQQVPGNITIMALAFALTFFIMGPVVNQTIDAAALIKVTDLSKAPTLSEFSKYMPLVEPWKAFMAKHAGARELALFHDLSSQQTPQSVQLSAEQAKSSLSNIIAAFVISELKQGFAIGFVLLLPFLVVDLIVANILVGMGMSMVSPVMISLPLKLILFVVADGWILLAKGLIGSYA